ncbi:MAG: hypothetical protein GF364_13020 [Candidatus Lokiarchaeota archaeon]|nr:hypothetical protein [Candidatus Lokiarchaeota archaeon]
MNTSKSIEFDPDFILWILIQFRNRNYDLEQNFRVDFFRDLSTSGEERDLIGKKISTTESENIAESVPILLTILSGKKPESCKFAFTIDGFSGSIKIEKLSVLSISHSIGIFKRVSSEEKLLISIHFLNRLLILYKKWLEMPTQEKYPDESEFLDLVADCKKLGLKIYTVNSIIDEYKRKRGE